MHGIVEVTKKNVLHAYRNFVLLVNILIFTQDIIYILFSVIICISNRQNYIL